MNNIADKDTRERAAVYIDGSNFYGYLMDEEINFEKGQKFNYKSFVGSLVGKSRVCVSKRFYTGAYENVDGSERSRTLVRGQRKFFRKLKEDGFVVKEGRIMFSKKHPNEKPKEKGTDVKIAVDLVIGAVDNHYDTAILISSDTDLIPAILYIKYKKKKLEYVGFSHDPSLRMQKFANLIKLLSAEDIERYTEKNLISMIKKVIPKK